MKKEKHSVLRPDRNRPEKPPPPRNAKPSREEAEVFVPSYAGPTKTDKPPRSKASGSGSREKPAFKGPSTLPRKAQEEYDDQRPRRSRGAGESAEQYVRLRIRVVKGRLSVVDSHLVDGPLSQARSFPGGNAYEVTLGDRLLHAGALPDLGVQRSFVDPPESRKQRGHHLTERAVYEFTVRVPAYELTRDTIGQISVRLYRLKEEARSERFTALPLSTQFERQARLVSEMTGLPDSVLPRRIEKRGDRTPKA